MGDHQQMTFFMGTTMLTESMEIRRAKAVPIAGVKRASYFTSTPPSLGENDLEDQNMNKDIVEGKWKQIRGEVKAWWGKLTDDDLDRAAGKFDVLAGLLQEKYGYTRKRAADEIDKHVTKYEAGLKSKTEPTPIK